MFKALKNGIICTLLLQKTPALTQHFVMKRLFVFILASSAITLAFGQAPYYILYNANSMDQLEYKYTYQGSLEHKYIVRPSGTEQFILTAANEGITSPTQPKGAVAYRDLHNNTELLDMVNNHSRNVYMVHPRSSGDFLLMPIIEASYVVKNGAFYMVTASNYAFALDTTRLINETNLATGRSQSYVYFTGMKFRDCRIEYAFRREPSRTNTERSDFEFMPGIGITSQRSGKNATEAETNHLRLMKVDGVPLDDYIAQGCGSDPEKYTNSTISPYTPPVEYGNTPPPTQKPAAKRPEEYQDYNKEDLAIRQKQERAIAKDEFDFNQCPELPGRGYHIVKPGDNLRAIARTYNKSLQDLISWNKIKNADKIEVCQKIWLSKPPKNSVPVEKNTPAESKSLAKGSKEKMVEDQSNYWNDNTYTPENGVKPARYSTAKSPAYNGPADKVTQVMPAVAAVEPHLYKVKSGDYLYKIAKDHGCLEECIRRANKMPLEGDITLWPGQELIIPECTCKLPSGSVSRNAAYLEDEYTPAPDKSKLVPKSPGNDNYYRPQAYNNGQSRPAVEPASTPDPSDKPDTDADNDQDTYFTEHIVKVGDTINSIGYRYRVPAAELAQLNNLKPNDQLVAGTRLLIPHKK